VEQFAIELPTLTPQQLEQISNPQTLDNDQHELMENSLQDESSPASGIDFTCRKRKNK
jgi:hypothetical protein